MSRFRHLFTPYWAAGLVLSVCGVVLARSVAPTLADKSSALLTAIGQLTALAGLLVIAMGVRRRVHHAASSSQPDQS